MNKVISEELRKSYLEFFRTKGHKIIPSASLIPENDPSVLFTTAGMHPLVPYLLGEKHPQGTRLTDVQKCVRTGDIDDVGDATHCTFFEMLGNWSLGDYFKKESISWSFEFLTKVLQIPIEKLAVTVFAGDEDCEKDEESASIWEGLGIPKSKIFYLPKEHNWWWAGPTGPCGPDTEIFMDTGKGACSDECSPSCNCGKYVEIWNNVFMQFNRTADGKLIPLEKKNVDTGMGLERTLCTINGVNSVYESDVFEDSIQKIAELSGKNYNDTPDVTKAFRIIADHIRTATFIMGDYKGVTPSNVDQGYVVRRLIRRAIRFARTIGLNADSLIEVSKVFIKKYCEVYPELEENRNKIIEEFAKEGEKFSKTLEQGLKEFEKVISHIPTKTLNGKTAFRLYDTFGFPLEMTIELAKEKGYEVDLDGYKKAQEEHIKKSSQGAEQKFKGGLQDNSQDTVLLHTATHLLLASLKKVLGDDAIQQKGSNITAERLRFDFNFDRPLTNEELQAVETAVNDIINQKIEVVCEEMDIEKARLVGATGVFANKYGEIVKVYTIGSYSKEMCGGPHAKNTGDLVKFKIIKEQSSSAGVRRIKAVLIK